MKSVIQNETDCCESALLKSPSEFSILQNAERPLKLLNNATPLPSSTRHTVVLLFRLKLHKLIAESMTNPKGRNLIVLILKSHNHHLEGQMKVIA